MSLTRKFLAAMGIEADKVDEIIAAHSETVEGLKAERDQYKKDAEKLPKVQEELDALKPQVEEFKPYKEKYDKEHADFEAYKNEQSAKATKAAKTEAYKALLKEAGVSDKHLNAVLRVSDLDAVELDDKGKVKDSKKALESIKNDWSDFIVEKETKGADTSTPPAGDGTTKYHGTGRAAKIAAAYNANLYGVAPSTNNNGGNE